MPDDDKYRFDSWVRLARTSPNEFEQRRREFIEDYISGLSGESRQRLIRLQWRIDAERKRLTSKNKDPYFITSRLYALMWDSFAGENGLNYCLHAPVEVRKQQESATILPFSENEKNSI